MNRFKIVFMALLILTLVLGVVATYCYVKAKEYEYGACGYCFVAEEINRPAEYWVLTDPDKWVLEAIENLGKGVDCIGEDMAKQTFTQQAAEHGGIRNVEYQGKYYYIRVLFIDTVPTEIIEQQVLPYASAGLTASLILLVAIGIVWFKTRKIGNKAKAIV